MPESVYAVLASVWRRQRAAFVLRLTMYGLLAGSLAGLLFGFIAWRYGSPLPLGWAVAVVTGAGPALAVVCALAGLLWRRGIHEAAVAVDRHYQLKDRSATALEFLGKPAHTPLQTLQIADAAQHLQHVDPRQVAPLQRPRSLPYALGLWVAAAAIAVLMWVFPFGTPAVEAGPAETPPQILAEAERLQESLQDLEEAARQEDNKELEKLVEQLRQKIEEMKQPGVDEREALAKLSEMESAIQSQQAQYNTAVIDGQLQSLGSAMSAAVALEGAGKALEESKLDKAAKELEQLEDPQLDRKEQKVVEEKLKQVAKEMGDVGLGQLSGAVSDFADSLKGGKGKGKKATKVLAREVKNQARRKRINDLLTGKLEDLKESKCNCERNSLITGKKPEKSKSPSSTFGATTSGNVQGDKTKLLGQNNQVNITGKPGEGPSDVETTASPEARQKARRGYKETYQKYRKMSDAVLDSEPIPLGHRQTIRRYFELIRPTNSDKNDKKDGGR
ncbi:MAG TPA: hypothetical protein VMF69_16480 [Gemmataceae bacterium]|nr:hypothetical protein [Gemmataceae bacterium]